MKRPRARFVEVLPSLLLLCVVATSIDPSPLAPQAVRGIAFEAGRDEPVEGAFVSLIDEAGEVTASTLTGADGAYALRAPAPGTYRLQVERIGYERWTSAPFALGPGESVARRLEIDVRAVRLDDLAVTVESHCRPRPGAGPAMARAWEEARKALEMTRWTEEESRVRFALRRWERDLDPETERVRREETLSAEKRAWRSFVSAPAEELAAEGYVRRLEGGGWQYFAPDAGVLLSDAFADGHCFTLVQGRGDEEGLVGLSFEPVDRRRPDVAGVLWLDPGSAELRHLGYRYTDLDLGIPRPEAGGRVEFARLPSGHWFVRQWNIRMPIPGERTGVGLPTGPGGLPLQPKRELVLALYRDVGGEVVEATLPDGETVRLAEWGAIAGIARDSLRGDPIPGIDVRLAGTAYRGRTDADGRFRIDPVPPGEYTLVARHPDAALLGLPAREREISVRAEDVARVELAFPSLEAREEELQAVVDEILAAGAEEEDEGLATLVGTVRSAETGQPIAGARVRLLERDEERATGAGGAFVMTDLPRGRYHVVTEYLGMASDTAEVDLRVGAGQVALFTLATRPVPLPALDVQIERTFRSHRLAGFYERMHRGLGDFVTREDLEARDVISNFRRIPSVRIDQCVVNAFRKANCWDLKISRGRGLNPTARCPPLVYLDGNLLTAELQAEIGGNPFTVLQKLPRHMLEGIEVYRSPAGAPAQYRMLGDACGIILVWTRGR